MPSVEKIYILGLFLFICVLCQFSHGLNCRVENDMRTQEEFEEIVRNCMNIDHTEGNRGRNRDRNNNNHNRPWNNRATTGSDHRNNRGRYNSDEDQDNDDGRYDRNNRRGSNNNRRKQSGNRFNSDKDSKENGDYDYESDKWFGQNDNKNNHRKSKPGRKSNSEENQDKYGFSFPNSKSGRRDKNNKDEHHNGDDDNEDNDGGDNEDNYHRSRNNPFNKRFNASRGNNHSNRQTTVGSPLEEVDACVIHCVFRQMKMVSEDSYLDRNTVMNVLTRRTRNPELKAFVQESVNDCFEQVEAEENTCDNSKSFAICLEEKGKSNCDDWDLSKKSGRKNGQRNNNNYNSYNGYSYPGYQTKY